MLSNAYVPKIRTWLLDQPGWGGDVSISASSTILDEAALRRMIAEIDKFVAEQRKLMAESQKLDREGRLAPWLECAGLIGGVVTIASGILRTFGVIP